MHLFSSSSAAVARATAPENHSNPTPPTGTSTSNNKPIPDYLNPDFLDPDFDAKFNAAFPEEKVVKIWEALKKSVTYNSKTSNERKVSEAWVSLFDQSRA